MELLNTSNNDTSFLVKKLSDEQFRHMIPGIVYISILMVFGFVGNAMVFHYYWCKARITTYSIFISVLAVYDMMTCSFSMPMEIARSVRYYTFDSEILCRLLRFFNYFASVGSVLALIIIAIDRYRRICKWSSVQMNISLAKRICWVTVLIAIFLSWPAFFLYGLQKISIPNNFGVELEGTICTGTWDKSYKPYITAFYSYMFALLVICSVVLTTLYFAIGRKLYRHYKKSITKRRRRQPEPEENSTQMYTITTSGDGSSCDVIESSQLAKVTSDSDDKGHLTLMLVAVTVLFLISYVPVFAIIIWRQRVGKHQIQFLSGGGLVAFELASTSFLISSAANPWIYGILCKDFRQYFTMRLKDLTCRNISH